MTVVFSRSARALLPATIAAAIVAVPAFAVTINASYVEEGEGFFIGSFDTGRTASGPGTSAGGGTLEAVFEEAASQWEAAILDDYTINIQFGWEDLTGRTLGRATTFTTRSSLDAVITFDSTGTNWFLDPTPEESSEYGSFQIHTRNLGAGEMIVGEHHSDAMGDAAGRHDLLSVALHEIGHAVGIREAEGENFDAAALTVSEGPYAGAKIDLVSLNGGHLDNAEYDYALLEPFLTAGERKEISDLDLVTASELQGWDIVVLDMEPASAAPSRVPIPASAALLLSALAGFGVVRRRR